MEELIKSIVDKISSYNIFNNLFPGAAFCYILNKITRFAFLSDNFLEQLFIWYFVGIIISRIGSVFVEESLKKLKIKGNPYLVFADYNQYCAASKENPIIETLSEVNNTYRTIIALLLTLIVAYLYDIFIFDFLTGVFPCGNKMVLIILGLLAILLFVKSYKKQTDYIKKRVDKYINDTNSLN